MSSSFPLTLFPSTSAALLLSLVAFLTRALYRLFFSPLSSLPGPKLSAISHLPLSRSLLSGYYHRDIKILHDRYGPVVRISPTQVSFNSPAAWRDIYAHVPGRKQFLKTTSFYTSKEAIENILTVREPGAHTRMRKVLAPGFSAKALRDQEPTVQKFIDKLIHQINHYGTSSEGAEMVNWYTFCVFDIIGDMTFGEAFGSLNDGKPHFWVEVIFRSVKAAAHIQIARFYPFLLRLRGLFAPKALMEARERQVAYSSERLKKRIKEEKPKKDLFTPILATEEGQDLARNFDVLRSQAGILITGGSETTSTCLAATTNFLCRTPTAYRELAREIRTTFTTYDSITRQSTESLECLNAVISEGLRIFPPSAFNMPRDSPGETVDGIYIPEGTEVSISAWAATRSETNFHNPQEFLPERWMGKGNEDRLDASQPFSLGARGCIGQGLAMMELRLILAKIFWCYDMTLVDENLDWDQAVEMWIFWQKPELWVRFAKREGVVIPPVNE